MEEKQGAILVGERCRGGPLVENPRVSAQPAASPQGEAGELGRGCGQ